MRKTLAKALVDKRGRLRLNFLIQQAVKIAYDQRIGIFFDLFKFFFNKGDQSQRDQLGQGVV